MTCIGLTRDDLTPDESVNPMDCPDVAAMIDDWAWQLSMRTDATLPNGEVVIHYDYSLEYDIVAACHENAHLAANYFKSLNNTEQD